MRDFLRFSWWMLLACAWLACAPARTQAQQPASSRAVDGKQVFLTTCAACHGLDGGGGEHAPDISHRREVQRLPDKALQRIVREGVPGTAMPAFGSLGSAQVEAVVRYLRSLQGEIAPAAMPGDPKQGETLFFGKAGCSQCHTAKGEGGFMGPDLSAYAGPQSAAEIRSAITDPNRDLDPRKRPVTVTTADGRTLTGIARNEDNFSLNLQTSDGVIHLLSRSDLRSIGQHPRSLMPDDYGSKLSGQELDDLVSYLINLARDQKKPQAEME